MSGKTIGNQGCAACGETAAINEGKNGTLSVSCAGCGALTMVKSPKAVAAMRARLGAAAPPKTPQQEKDFLADL